MRLLALTITISFTHVMTVGKLQPRDVMLSFKVSLKLMVKLRMLLNTTDKANNAKDQTVTSIYDNRFCIPLDFEILESSLPLYQYGLGSCLMYELTFADYSDVIKSTDPDGTYMISNISL